jgi:hypothetical protein
MEKIFLKHLLGNKKVFRMSKFKKRFLLGVLFFSILLNLVFVKADIYPLIKRKYLDYNTTFLTDNITPEKFNDLILSGAKASLNDNYSAGDDLIIRRDIRASIYTRHYKVFEYGEYGFLMWLTLKSAIEQNNNELINVIKDKFDNAFLSTDDFLIERTDQTIYGSVAIELFLITNDIKYKQFANGIYNKLNSLKNHNGLITYRKELLDQQVDLLGFVCPFLSEYGRVFGNEESKKMGALLIEEFIKYGVDKENGIPSQGYSLATHIKTGYNNWGRGMAWYALALCYVDEELLSEEAKLNINKFTKSVKLAMQSNNWIMNQFPGKSEIPDMSATIPLLFYLHGKKELNITKKDFIKLIKPYVMTNGQVGYNSPGIQYHNEVFTYMRHDLSQGMMCLLYSKLN